MTPKNLRKTLSFGKNDNNSDTSVDLDDEDSQKQYGMHILTEEQIRMREYHKNIHHKSKEDKEKELSHAKELIHILAREKKERERKLKMIHDQQDR